VLDARLQWGLFMTQRRRTPTWWWIGVVAALLSLELVPPVYEREVLAQGPGCGGAANPIVCENALTGSLPSEWELPDGPRSGDPSIQGFPTDISIDQGQAVSFKINSGGPFRIDLYRMGYYGGRGARKIASLESAPSVLVFPAQSQPACNTSQALALGLIDCGNWAVTTSWTAPADATSGIYFARLTRTDVAGMASHLFFMVRDDDGHSPLLFQTSDTTWQAYNSYGGNSLYQSFGPNAATAGRAYKVSYNRPLTTADDSLASWIFNAEYPMVRWLEANGYNVSYFAGVDTDRRGTELLEHAVFLSVGHDEYWSATQRANVEFARDTGRHLAFFSGNEVFWKTRWEDNHRTLVSYKETHDNAKIDPSPEWTGTWRDPRFSPPADGGRPENALTGTIFTVNGPRTDAIQVPESFGRLRFWRNTSIADLAANQIPNQVAVLPPGTLGYEWDEDVDNGARPAGLIRLSSTTLPINGQYLLNFGSLYGNGVGTHSLTLYRHASGALVFGAGTVQWPWGLDGEHDRGFEPPSLEMRQATVNLFADMGVLPGTPQTDLIVPTASIDSIDLTAPTSSITSPSAGTTVQAGVTIPISGSATDTGGVVAGVEVSVDGGATWHAANGLENWTYNWTPAGSGPITIRSRAVDDSGNLGSSGTGVTVTVARICPCTIWPDSATPAVPVVTDPTALELGVRFRSEIDGVITGVRFYKGGTANSGPHTGSLWTNSGSLLANVAFTNETASGWQQASFGTPVPITANTTYVVSYFTQSGNYSITRPYFTAEVANAPLHALQDGADGPNGVYRVGNGFPGNTFEQTNYWVDVVFATVAPPDTTPPAITARAPVPGATEVSPFTNVTASFNEALDPATVTANSVELRDPLGDLVNRSVSYVAATRTVVLDPTPRLTDATLYTATIRGGASGVKDIAGNPLASDMSWSFTTALPVSCDVRCTIFPATAVPVELVNTIGDSNSVELGLKFRSDVDGFVTGIRFYKGNQFNAAPHTGTLWTAGGEILATILFGAETDSGWQEATFAAPVPITANTTYLISYHTSVGRYSVDRDYFLGRCFSHGPLRALADGEDGPNGLYGYDPPLGLGGFPTNAFRSSNYWVDVVFRTAVTPSNRPPVADTQSVTTQEDIPLSVTLIGSDLDNDPLTFAIVTGTGPSHGTLSGTAPNLTYTPAANYYGPDSFTFTANDGALDSVPATVSITVTAVNDAPGFTKGADPTVAEEAGAQSVAAWATAISAGPANEVGQLLNFVVSNNNNALFSVQPAVAADGTLTYAPAPNANGLATVTVQLRDDGGGANGGADTSAAQTFTISVTAVNDAPSFTMGANQTVAEDAGVQSVAAWATAISAGPANEAGQLLNFIVSNNNNTLFSVQPAVAADGTLTYTPAANTNGSATVTVQLHDDGGSATGGADTSAAQTFTITVMAVNEAPSFTMGTNQTVAEDTSAQSVAAWATAISAGPANEAGQLVNFIVSNNNNALFSVQPAVAADGTLTYTPAANANGPATVTVQLHDDGGGANGGADTSAAQTFTIAMTAVNDAPSFTIGVNQTVPEDAGVQSVAAWATAISVGPANEAGQLLNFIVSNNNNALFSVQPAVAADGTLNYAPAPNANGSATVTVQLHDDGGIANGGTDTSTAQTFTITVTAINDAPVAMNDVYSTNEDTAFAPAAPGVRGNDTDVDGNPLTAVLVSGPSQAASFTLNSNGSFTYTPASNFFGTDSFTYKVNDGSVDSDAATVTITVTSVNDLPTIPDIVNQTTPESFAVGPLSMTIGDIETTAASLTLTGSSTNTALVPVANIAFGGSGANRTVTVTPVAGQTGFADITVTMTDGNGGTANDTFRVTVTPRTPTTASTPTSSLNPSIYGQAVTFTTTVTGAGGPPTGSVTFFDNGASLGTATLNAGTATLVTTAVSAGTRSITTSYAGNTQFASSTSAALSQTVNKASSTSTLTLSKSPQQYSDLETFKATVTTVNGQLPAESVTFKVGTQVVGTVPLTLVGGVPEATAANVPLLEPTPWGTLPTGQMKPTPIGRTVTATFNNVSPNFTVLNATKTLSINKEDARATYTGTLQASTANSATSTAPVTLSATIQDISATAQAGTDTTAGDIRHAMVTFINRETGAAISPALNVTLPNSNDTKNGSVTYTWTVNLGAANAQTIRVGIIVDNYYTRTNSDEDALLTVARGITTGFSAGGGNLTMSASGGLKRGDAGSTNNFGFGVSYTGNGANPVGHFNTMLRSTGGVYHVKGTTYTSLVVTGKTATLRGTATIYNVTNGSIVVDSAATFEVTINDIDAGPNDRTGIQIKNGAGAVWFSSNWNGAATIDQILGAGNLKLP